MTTTTIRRIEGRALYEAARRRMFFVQFAQRESMEHKIIAPTIGRKLYFYPPKTGGLWNRLSDQPFDATIIYVHDERLVNLNVIDHQGNQRYMSQVFLAHPDDKVPEGAHCRWMPYQVGQAPQASDVIRRLEELEHVLNEMRAAKEASGTL